MVDILIGLLSPTDGRVLIDGRELDSTCQQAWTRSVGYVPQSPYILYGTLAENVAFGFNESEIDRERVRICCEMAAMQDFLKDLPQGLDTLIGERGVRLSGGQQQRVSIARALYSQPEVMIFDEATSSLDLQNEKMIQKTIYSFKGKQTLIIIAHRLSSVEDCDFIIWIDDGRIKMMDCFNKIVPIYRELDLKNDLRDHKKVS